MALEKAPYAADRARRQYDAVEPENRLVSAELEARWNAALAQVSESEARLQLLDASLQPLSDAQRLRLLELGSDLRAAWEHPHALCRSRTDLTHRHQRDRGGCGRIKVGIGFSKIALAA